ncbi:MAG: hypothetical protein N2C14_21440 [Planctomycetales bacterium]
MTYTAMPRNGFGCSLVPGSLAGFRGKTRNPFVERAQHPTSRDAEILWKTGARAQQADRDPARASRETSRTSHATTQRGVKP